MILQGNVWRIPLWQRSVRLATEGMKVDFMMEKSLRIIGAVFEKIWKYL